MPPEPQKQAVIPGGVRVPPAPTKAPVASEAVVVKPRYSEKHHLTRHGMEQVIKEGGSVEYKGRIITNATHLPSEAELAQASGSPAEVERVRAEKQAEIDRLKAELADMKQPKPADKPAEEPAR